MILAFGWLLLVWVFVYLVGCVVWLFLIPKIVKAFFNGTSIVGTMIGGALTSLAAGMMGGIAFGAATGLFGKGALGGAASNISGVGGGGAGSPTGPNPFGGGVARTASNLANGKSPGGTDSPEDALARLATAAATGSNKPSGAVSATVNRRRSLLSDQFVGAPISPANSTSVGAPLQAVTLSSAIPSAGFALDTGIASRTAARVINFVPPSIRAQAAGLFRGGAEIVKHVAMAAGSNGSLGSYVQTYMTINKGKPARIGDNAADQDVPNIFS